MTLQTFTFRALLGAQKVAWARLPGVVRGWIALLLAACILSVGGQAAVAAESGSISGVVVDQAGVPVAGARVFNGTASGVTDAAGAFDFVTVNSTSSNLRVQWTG